MVYFVRETTDFYIRQFQFLIDYGAVPVLTCIPIKLFVNPSLMFNIYAQKKSCCCCFLKKNIPKMCSVNVLIKELAVAWCLKSVELE